MRYAILSLALFSLLAASCGSDSENPEPDASMQTPDMATEDMATMPDLEGGLGADMATDLSETDFSETDAETDMAPDADPVLTCDEGRINLDGDDSNGCESPDFPAYYDEACQPCWGLADAVAGCSQGTCYVMYRDADGAEWNTRDCLIDITRNEESSDGDYIVGGQANCST